MSLILTVENYNPVEKQYGNCNQFCLKLTIEKTNSETLVGLNHFGKRSLIQGVQGVV